MNDPSAESLRRLVREVLDAVLRERGVADRPEQERMTVPNRGAATGSSGTAPESNEVGRLVILLTGGSGDLESLRLVLQTLSREFVLDLLIATDFTDRYGAWIPSLPSERVRVSPVEGIESSSFLDGARAIVVPLMTRRLAAKVSLAIDDEWPAGLLLQALVRGLPVFATLSDADPDSLQAVPSLLQGPNSLRHLLETYMRRLSAWGVRWTSADQIHAALGALNAPKANPNPQSRTTVDEASRPPLPFVPTQSLHAPTLPVQQRRFVTREDLWNLLESGQRQLDVGPNDIVTPEAEEFAKSRGIELRRSNV